MKHGHGKNVLYIGTMTYPDQSKNEGNWNNDQLDGEGKLKITISGSYSCGWNKNKTDIQKWYCGLKQ